MDKGALNAVAVLVSGALGWTAYHALPAGVCAQRGHTGCPDDFWAYVAGGVACVVAQLVLAQKGARLFFWGYGTLAGIGAGGILAGTVGTAPGTDWPLVQFGGAVLLAPVVLVGGLGLLVLPVSLAERRRRRRLLSRGVPATGTVMSVVETGVLKGRVTVRMRLRIEPPAGAGEVFEEVRTGAVASDAVPEPGDTFAVVVDVENPGAWAFADGAPDLGTRRSVRQASPFGEAT
jgi:hypothetical protein